MYEFWISIISLIMAIIAVWISYSTQNKANEIQQRLVHIEEQREYDRKIKSRQANLRAELRKDERAYKLYLINSGEAEARNIRIKIDGEPLEQHCAFVKGQSIPSYIGHNSEISCLMAFYFGCYSSSFEVEVKWDDDYQKDRTYKSMLTL
jgi:archaellum component FlaG (FlaF/FlaG flagellin family)